MLDKLPERLRESARGTARASQMLADDKSARNRAAGDEDACYEGLKPEQTCEWQGAELIERLTAELAGESESRERLYKALRQKDEAMGVLFERLAKAGVDCSDLIS